MKECTTDIADVLEIPDVNELTSRLQIAVDEQDVPSLVLMIVSYDGERDEAELLGAVNGYLVEAANPGQGVVPVNFSADPDNPQIIDFLAAKGPYFAIMLQMSNGDQARAAFQNLKTYLLQKPELQQGVDVKARIATYEPGKLVGELLSAAEEAPLK